MDDELNILPISSHMKSVTPVPVKEDSEGLSEVEHEMKDMKEELKDAFLVGPLIKKCCTHDHAKAVSRFLEAILDTRLRNTVALLAGRGRGKSAALGLAIARAVAAGYSNIFVTAPSPENLKRLWELLKYNSLYMSCCRLTSYKKKRCFKVIAASEIYGDKSLLTEVYDSKLASWSLHETMPAVNLCSSKMAFCDSRLYMETISPLGLMMYQLDAGYWEHIPTKFPQSLLDGYLVAGTQKRLFLVGRIGLYSTLQSMIIWELDHVKVIWIEISRMPPRYFRALLRLLAERFKCLGRII